ncbi:MAG: class I SAM-dependent methyltransferase [Promethearchaeota archaeon]
MIEKIKQSVKKILKSKSKYFPSPFDKLFYDLTIEEKIFNFEGWGMKTMHSSPWEGGFRNKAFLSANDELKTNFELVNLTTKHVDTLLWRHWIVTYSLRHAIEFTDQNSINLVECGVAEGVTAFFLLKELKEQKELGLIKNYSLHCYDAWEQMREEYLLKTEKSCIGKFSNLNIELVKRNLSEFSDNVVYHQGYIPDSLKVPPSAPESISFLHIDLNSVIPTQAALEFFYPKILRGGTILFDDYGDKSYSGTKECADRFFSEKPGSLMPLPTGQAIYFL